MEVIEIKVDVLALICIESGSSEKWKSF